MPLMNGFAKWNAKTLGERELPVTELNPSNVFANLSNLNISCMSFGRTTRIIWKLYNNDTLEAGDISSALSWSSDHGVSTQVYSRASAVCHLPWHEMRRPQYREHAEAFLVARERLIQLARWHAGGRNVFIRPGSGSFG